MWDFRNNPPDQLIYGRAFNNALNLIAGKNGGNFKRTLSDRFRQDVDVTTYSRQIRSNELNQRGAKGLTGLAPNNRVNIRLYGLDVCNEKDFMHNATHENFHAWTEILHNISGVSKDRYINGTRYRVISGTIYKERTPEQISRNEDNETYGGAYNECMMDILSECAFVGYDDTLVNDTNVDEVIKNNRWHNPQNTAYARIL